MKTVEFLNLKKINKGPFDRFKNRIEYFYNSGVYIGGEIVESFERRYADFCDKKYFIGTGNGYDALYAALCILDLQNTDEVIVPAHTFIATWLAVSHTGAKLVPVDVDMCSYQPSIQSIIDAVTANTKVIIVVDLYGQAFNTEILRQQIRDDIIIINDAAQAHGSKYNNNKVGKHSDLSCWSFYPGKTLGALGDAGGVSTDNQDYARRIRQFINYGSTEKYNHLDKGVNSRLDPVQALFLDEKLSDLEKEVNFRNEIADIYDHELLNTDLITPERSKLDLHGFHLYVVRADNRSELLARLDRNNIGYGIHYPRPCFQQPAYIDDLRGGEFPNSVQIANSVVSLPIGSHMTLDDAYLVTQIIKNKE